ncbi:MAG TPA: RdgB/HAM1 family non-canonical purine NTP pyrophosphatase [Verrucomicrobiales bacterium]|nr:RdgB/HAM1 family non-canonical purine NTP pyrophosphatase [Verrucomicrobiales bacterium]
MQDLLIATRNAHKTTEFRQLLGPCFTVRDLTGLAAVPEVEESGATFLENARLKALAISRHFPGQLVLADDSGLEVDVLEGAPGVHSARFAGRDAGDASNRALLLRELEKRYARGKQRSARFRCTLVLARDGREILHSQGDVPGWIIHRERGKEGFGYDPLFVPAGRCHTFAQLPPEDKNRLSHRCRAVESLLRKWASAAPGRETSPGPAEQPNHRV